MNKNKITKKKWFDIRVECTVPATLTYHILAYDAEEASKLIKKHQPNSIKYKLPNRKEIKLMVYDAGTCMIKFIKNLL